MQRIKNNLFFSGLLTQDELKTLTSVKEDYVCDHCLASCTSLHTLVGCESKICFTCLEKYFDENVSAEAGILFICPCCKKNISDFMNFQNQSLKNQ